MNQDVAPCDLGKGTGDAYTMDADTKEGVCMCQSYVCLIDRQNRVLNRRTKQNPEKAFSQPDREKETLEMVSLSL
ncbi:hypothetical protein A2382_00950 [Candidatus Woesebacteria bacterium RIFOXYB1_FULL_38_16]|uniref:Uncharacterized protein n=1 Tax=Candidatus Woesebacteria bacterium RIFOXYB1_FULL_38_16 TaxID=1802538 RepID=A0A1F8CSN5_9BACT|nr:MAG: hypothetical protein A2382_00950 [Candidatus Woesebacteria bacterium RIFOXYB1_FULL_38_16]